MHNAVRIGIVIAALLLCTVVRATSTWVTLPPYWTGTYNRAEGTVVGGSFLEGILWVNSTMVRHYVFEDPVMQHFTLSVVVDSTHFSPGSSVQILFEAKLANGSWVSASGSVPVINQAWAWEFPEFATMKGGHASDNVQSLAAQAGWSCGEEHTIAWTPANVKAILAGQGVHYVNSHGAMLLHWSGHTWSTPWGTASEDVFADNNAQPAASYLHMRKEQVGDYDSNPSLPAPPYNPSGFPQMTFAFIDVCNSGAGNYFASVLYPYRIYDYGPSSLDQAVLTWNGYSSVAKADRMNQELWSRLKDGMTVTKPEQR